MDELDDTKDQLAKAKEEGGEELDKLKQQHKKENGLLQIKYDSIIDEMKKKRNTKRTSNS